MTDHSTDPEALARQTQNPQTQNRQTQSGQTQSSPIPDAHYDQGTAQANPAHQNPRPDHPGPINPVTPAYAGSRSSEPEQDDLLGRQPGATPALNPADSPPGSDNLVDRSDLRDAGSLQPDDRAGSAPQDWHSGAQQHPDDNAQHTRRGMPDYAAPAAAGGHYRPDNAPSQGDADLMQQVHDRLDAHPLIDPREIEVLVQQGRVTLRGTVSHPETIQNAAICLAPVPGIVALDNELRTGPHDRKSASEQ